MLFKGLIVEDATPVGLAGHDLTIRPKNIGLHRKLSISGIDNFRAQTDGGELVRYVRRSQLHTPYRHMDFFGGFHMDITIETGSGIPAR